MRVTPLDDLLLLRAFVGVVDGGSISAAARTLRVPQPTLSRRLRLLEERCGAVLLRRDTHRLSLTEAGHRLRGDAQAMLTLAEEATQKLQEDQTALRGHLRLFATVDFGQFTVSRLLACFLRANPGVTAELGYTNRPLHMIQDGYDAGVIAGDITDESVVARPAGKIARHLVAAPEFLRDRPVVKKPADLQAWPWVTLSSAQFGGTGQVTLSKPEGKPVAFSTTPVLTSEGVTSIREAVRAGLGVAVLPDWLVRDDLVNGQLVRVLPTWSAPALLSHVIHPGQRALPTRVRAFVDFAVGYMGKELRWTE